MRAQERMGNSSMRERCKDHTTSAQERVNWVMDEVMSGRMSQDQGMVEMARAYEMMREEARTRHPPSTQLGGLSMARARKQPDPLAQRDCLILEIAQRHFSIEILETRNRDRLDFHDVAVWAIRDALEEAFEAGRSAGAAATTEPNS